MGFSKCLPERLVKKNQCQRNGESPENQRDWSKVGTMTTSGLEKGGGIFKIWSPKPLMATLHRRSPGKEQHGQVKRSLFSPLPNLLSLGAQIKGRREQRMNVERQREST